RGGILCGGGRGVTGWAGDEPPDLRGFSGMLLGKRLGRPHDGGYRRAAENHDELAPFHSITSSARPSIVIGTSRPSVFAVLRLIINSNLVGACTGRSDAFSPFKMRST